MTWKAECGMRNADSRASGRVAVRAPHATRRRWAFTLVELLIVISIIAVLSALLLGVAARAGETAREAKTKAMIARLNTLVMQYYDSYKYRRAPLNDIKRKNVRSIAEEIDLLPSRQQGVATAEARLYALRELMIMEMPDRWSDVLLSDVEAVNSPADIPPPQYLKSTSSSTYFGPTPLVEAYRRQYFSMLAAGVSKGDIVKYQGAECLYMIVMLATADGEARSLFNESSIGDTDGDGAYEFLDGWGYPIAFVRWAPGFDSDLQLNAYNFVDTASPENTSSWNKTAWEAAAAADHDPFDLFHRDSLAFRLVPVIYSSGGAQNYDLYTARATTVWPTTDTDIFIGNYRKLFVHRPVGSQLDSGSNIYEFLGASMNEAGNEYDPTGGADNISNHNITSE